MSKIILVGGGGFARVIAETLRAAGTAASGYVDKNPTDAMKQLTYLGGDADLLQLGPGDILLANGIGSVGVTTVRRAVFLRFKEAGFSFATIVHPSASVASDVELGEGAQVLAGSAVQSNVRLGRNTIVNVGVIVDHDGRIGDHAHLATGAVLAGTVTVGEASLVGAGASVVQGLEIGAEALIAAGAVVVRPVAAGDRVAGVPARSLKVNK